jgi:hypothetical protein
MGFIMKNVQLCVIASISFVCLSAAGLDTAKKSGELLPSEAEYVETLADRAEMRRALGLKKINFYFFDAETKRGKECNSLSERFVASFLPNNKESASEFDVTDEELGRLRRCIKGGLNALEENEKLAVGDKYIFDNVKFSMSLRQCVAREPDTFAECHKLDSARKKRHRYAQILAKMARLRSFQEDTEMLVQIREAAKNKEN